MPSGGGHTINAWGFPELERLAAVALPLCGGRLRKRTAQSSADAPHRVAVADVSMAHMWGEWIEPVW